MLLSDHETKTQIGATRPKARIGPKLQGLGTTGHPRDQPMNRPQSFAGHTKAGAEQAVWLACWIVRACIGGCKSKDTVASSTDGVIQYANCITKSKTMSKTISCIFG